MEELKTSNYSLNAKIEAQKQEITTLCEKLDTQKREWKAANSSLDSKVDAQKRELSSSLISVVETHRRELAAAKSELDSKVDFQAKQIRRLTNETSPFVWKVTGFNEVLRLAREGIAPRIYNEFYTGKRGYKLSLRLYPDGDQTQRNRYVSVFVGILKGEYDHILPWPFRQQVTFTVIDQQYDLSKRRNEVGVLNTEDTPWRFSGRPISEENPNVHGIDRLISHKVLFTRRYLKNDTLVLKVDVGPHDSQIDNSDSDYYVCY